MPPPQKVRLGDLLIQQGLLTDEQLKIALDEQKRTGRKLGRVFVESGYVTEEGISQALARQLRIPFVDLKNFTPKPDLIKLLPEAPARRFRAMVLAQLPDGRLQIGLAASASARTAPMPTCRPMTKSPVWSNARSISPS